MKLIEKAVQQPVSTPVGVILLTLFGVISLFRIPVQLIPDVTEPEISVSTIWPGASPQEVERELVEEQEDQLKSIPGLLRLSSESKQDNGTINLHFRQGTSLETAMVQVGNRLEQVPDYPDDAEKPVLHMVGSERTPSAWFVIVPHGDQPYEGSVATAHHFADTFLKPELERVNGVGQVNFFGGMQMQMQVVIDPERLAARGISLTELAAVLDRENRNYSGGSFPEGKRRYVVRTMGAYEDPADLEELVVAVRDGATIYLRDIAEVRMGYAKPEALAFRFGEPVLVMSFIRANDANILDVMEEIHEVTERVNRGGLAKQGLKLIQVFDETDYIESAIGLVRQSLILGGVLAIVVLLLFFRNHPDHCFGHPHQHGGYLSHVGPAGSIRQRDQSRWYVLCRGHGGRQCHRGSREHLSPLSTG
jgi:HAE1 family hydrophobic/amphiphilic exporter-1